MEAFKSVIQQLYCFICVDRILGQIKEIQQCTNGTKKSTIREGILEWDIEDQAKKYATHLIVFFSRNS
jgi:hypothetical protein